MRLGDENQSEAQLGGNIIIFTHNELYSIGLHIYVYNIQIRCRKLETLSKNTYFKQGEVSSV